MTRNLFIAHLFEPLPDGSKIRMHAWPLHLTLASNFFTELSEEASLAAIGRALVGHSTFEVPVVGEALFGEGADMPVMLLEPTIDLLGLHFDLSDLVNQHGRFEQPQYTGFGYRPHVTVQPDARVEAGATLTIDSVSVFDYNAAQNTRTLLKTWPLL